MKSTWAFLAFSLGILCLPLFVQNPYYLNILAFVGLYALVTIGLSLFIGYAGQISLGHGAFYASGAYISALLSLFYGLNPWLSMSVAVVFTVLWAFALGKSILRLRGHYLVMATLGVNLVVYMLLVELEPLTGGVSGLPGIPPFCVGDFCFTSDRACFYLIWGICLVVLAGALRVDSSPLGRQLRAIRGSELAAAALGLDVTAYKVGTFTLSAGLTALAGALYAHYLSFISPKTFDVFYSIEVVTMVLLGGAGNIWGAILGAFFLTPLPQLLDIVKEYKDLLYGLIIMGILVYEPEGLCGFLKRIPLFKEKKAFFGG